MIKACQIFTEADNFLLKNFTNKRDSFFAQSSGGTIDRLYHSMTVGVSCREHVRVARAVCGRGHKARGQGEAGLLFYSEKTKTSFKTHIRQIKKKFKITFI